MNAESRREELEEQQDLQGIYALVFGEGDERAMTGAIATKHRPSIVTRCNYCKSGAAWMNAAEFNANLLMR